ncbi:MAG TPA: aspartate/glutamate racemase family protein [Candidatus Rubrimentiphilum sp.]|nr:aspartate/glutamate racemase family protein [Candidatus Rubrimentiphilum sp.]
MTLGLIGGLGVPAGIHYYESIVRASPDKSAVLLAEADFETARDFVVAGDTEALSQYLAGMLTSLSREGATIGAVAAVTPHVCLEQLRSASPIPIIDLPSALNAALAERGLRRVSLFGTSFVIETDLFGCLDVEVVKPTPEEIRDIDAIYTRLARGGEGTMSDRERLSDIARRLLEKEHVDAIVLAGTDFVALYDAQPPDFPTIDASRVHIDAIIKRMAQG